MKTHVRLEGKIPVSGVLTAEEYRALPKNKIKQSFDGVNAIRLRLREMKIDFREEVLFAQPRKYRADFVIVGEDGPIVIEYSGATYVKAGHTSGKSIARDYEKSNLAQSLGFKYLQFSVDLLRKPGYFEEIIALAVFGEHPNKNWKNNKQR